MNKLFIGLLLFFFIAGSTTNAQRFVRVSYTSNIHAEQIEYLNALENLLYLDSNLTVNNRVICITPGSGPFCVLELVPGLDTALLRAGFIYKRSETPRSQIRAIVDVNSRVDPRIDITHIQLSRYSLSVSKEGDTTKLYLYDYLAKNPVRWSRVLLNNTDSIPELLLAELNRKQVDTESVQVVPQPIEYLVKLANKSIDNSTKELLRELSNDGWRMRISYSLYGYSGWYYQYKIDPKRIAEIGPLFLDRFVFLTLSRHPDSISSKLFDDTYIFDDFGNLISRDVAEAKINGVEAIDFISPFPLGLEVDTIAISFSLESLGYQGCLRDIFYCRTVGEVKVNDPWPYKLYSTPEAINNIDSLQIRNFMLGLADVESYFGFQLGQVISRIFISDDNFPNAGFRPADPAGVYVNAVTLSIDSVFGEKLDTRLIGQHEAVHVIGNILHINRNPNLKLLHESNQQFRSHYSYLDYEFFSELNEGSFDPDVQVFGGHSQSNAWELLASYITSVIRSDWESIMVKKSDLFKKRYAFVTQVVKNIFSDNDYLIDKTITDILKQRLIWLRQNE